ncbi:hypothetical protein BGZ96_003777 [Linnemannia gamsii]|uniref:Uncharacterized protein n=1 Tax=Linnemannia gamsii TaxID=64522 RepID=A0ABQ7K909_9FUNG|nr:hypothetical protein BGZ96_003777 [Linnemannia gamsii]
MATTEAFTSASTTPNPINNTPSITEINSITPGAIFNDEFPSSFIDGGDLSFDTPSPSSPTSSPHVANKAGSGGEHIGQIEVNSTTQTILVILGFCVGALFLVGVVAMYYITHKNRRAEEKKKRRDEEGVAVGAGTGTGTKFGQNGSSLTLPPSSSSSSLPLPSHPNISAGTGIGGTLGGGGLGGGGRGDPAHRIIITRSMTATTANTRVGHGGPNGCDEKEGGGSSGGLSPIGDGKSDMVTIYMDETLDDEMRDRHHCNGDDNDDVDEMDDHDIREKQELDQDIEGGKDPLAQERTR